jgi:hypothetical protein
MVDSATTALTKLEEERSRAASRVSELEREWRAAVEASRVASAELAEVERHGGSATTRHAGEEKLATAKAKAAEPWAERVEGARAAARDLDRRVRQHLTENLGTVVDRLEQSGEAPAEPVNTAAAALVAAQAEWEHVATQIGSTIAVVALPGPADVSRPRPEAEAAARAAAALLSAGGAEGPRLDRNRPPWARLIGLEEDEPDPELGGTSGDPEPVVA